MKREEEFWHLRQNREIDMAEMAYRQKFIAYYLFPGLFIGIALSIIVNPFVGVLAAVLIPLFTYLAIGSIARKTGDIYFTSGGRAKKQYSMQKSLVMQGKYEEAIELYRKELVNDPKDFEAQLEIAELIADELEDYPRAIKEFRKVQQMEIPNELNFYIFGRIVDIYANEIRNYDKAIGECKRAIKFSPEVSETFRKLLDEIEERKYSSELNE